MTSRRTFVMLVPALAAVRFTNAFANGYPTKPIRITVPISPGAGTDVTARTLAAALSQSWGTSIYVENKPGAGGVIGTQFVAGSAPDGYNILFTYASHYINQWVVKSTPYDAVKDFEPIARIASSALVLATAADSPFRSVADVIATAKKSPTTVSYASAGNGTPSHMCGALMSSMAGISFNHIPYRSAAQGVVDAASGAVNLVFSGMATVLPLIRSGRLKPLAVTGARRSMILPEVVTLAESGLQGYDLVSPIWVLAPRGTPQPIVDKLSEGLTRVASSQEFKEMCVKQGLEVDIQNAAAYKSSAPAELQKWKNLVALTGSTGTE